jgi:hypothetical protein
MKKKILLVAALVLCVFSGSAQQWEVIREVGPVTRPAEAASSGTSFDFGYCTDNIAGMVGYSPNTTVRVAFLIPKSVAVNYAGAQITKIHVGFGSSVATNTSVFIAESLTGSALAYSQSASFTTLEWNAVHLTTPYTITGEKDVLVGYEYTGGGEGDFYSIGLDDSTVPSPNGNYFSVRTGLASYSSWESLASYGFFNATLKATIEGNLPEYNLGINSVVTSALDVVANEPFSVITGVTNKAIRTINSVELEYEIGGTVSREVVSDISIKPLQSFSFTKEVSLSTDGAYSVKVTVLKLNGDREDTDASDNSLSAGQDVWVGNSVPTISRKRNVVLEEYTGIYCVYCPDGHKKANDLKASNPAQVEVINIHQGSFANPSGSDPDFRTPWGDALMAQTGLTGYPSGTVNRHLFSGTGSILGRGDWASAAQQIISQSSPVNLHAEASVDWTTNRLTVDVSGYYTGNSAVQTNLLNVALLQENVLGPQTGASNFYPEMLTDGGLYRHNHMLRHLLTGQWGDTIYATTSGSSFSKQYVYTVPEDYTNVPVDLQNITVLAFIAQGKQEIITGTRAKIGNRYITDPTIKVVSVEQLPLPTIDNNILVQVVVQNISETPVSSYRLQYRLNDGEAQSYAVDGRNIQRFEQDTLLLPLIPVVLGTKYALTVATDQTNGSAQAKVYQSATEVSKDVCFASSRLLRLKLWQDTYGSETTWALFDADGKTITDGGPYEDLANVGTQLHEHDLTVPTNGAYRFEIYDEFGDGINSGYGEGKYEIWAGDVLVTSGNGRFGAKETKLIGVSDETSVREVSVSDIAVYSYDDRLHVLSPVPVAWVAVYDALGKQVISQDGKKVVSLKELNRGIYIVKVLTQSGVEKVVKIVR